MPGTTTRNGLRYPLTTEAPDGPGGLSQLAADVEQYIGGLGAEYCANVAAVNAIPAARLYSGKRAVAADTGWIYRYSGSAWVLWEATPIGTGSYIDSANGAGFDTNGGVFELNVTAGVAFFNFNFYKSSSMAYNTAYGILKAGWRPGGAGVVFTGAVYGAADGIAVMRIDGSGQVFMSWTSSGSAINALRGTASWRIVQ